MRAPVGEEITVSFFGFEDAVFIVGDKDVYDIDLVVSALSLDETVVIGYGTTTKKDAGDFNYKFEYDAAGYLVKGIYCDGNQDVVIFTRTIADKCATAYIQSKRYFEYGADWEKATVENAKENIRYTDTLNEDNFFAEYIDYRRNPDNGDLKLEKMFFYAGLFGKASAKLPEEAVWTNNDGSALPTDYYETTVDYAYTFDDEGHIAGFSVDGGGSVTEVAWETITLK